MASASLYGVLHYLRRLGAAGPPAAGEGDADLLRRFASGGDADAFAALVGRHGPLVWGVCTRALRDGPDAEDAFQATFVVLARKAGAVRRPELLGPWLYGVARRVAAKSRAAATRRRAAVQDLPEPTAVDPTPDVVWRDLRPVLDEEVGRLPEKYRVPFVLCHLKGLTNDEAARRLGCPKGTVVSRLSRARERLRDRLTRRGLGVPAGLLAAAVADHAAAAVPAAALVASTVRLGLTFAPGAAAPSLPTPATTLAEGVLHGMFLTKVKLAAACFLALGLVGSGAGLLSHRLNAGQEPAAQGPGAPPPKAPPPARAAAEKAPPAAKEAEAEAVPTLERRDLELRDALRNPIRFNGADDSKMTLAEVLEQLAKQYHVAFDVNEKAFRLENKPDVLQTQVATTPIPAMTGSLASVLQRILARVDVSSGATYIIRKEVIEITTNQFLYAELRLPPEGNPADGSPIAPLGPQLIYEDLEEAALPAALRKVSEATGVTVVLDPKAYPKESTPKLTAKLMNVPVETAVRVLADMADLQVIRLDNVLYVTTAQKAARLRKESDAKRDGAAVGGKGM
jgi:RNA polymerase sigma factor (sigma-70 family)